MNYSCAANMLLNSTSDGLEIYSANLQHLNYSLYSRLISNVLSSLRNYISLLFVLGFPILLPYVYSSRASTFLSDQKSHGRLPPTAPYNIPILGHVVSFAWDVPGFLTSMRKRYENVPVRVRLPMMDLYLITGDAHIVSLFSQSQIMTNKIYRVLAVSNMFGMPAKAKDFLAADDSGLNSKPHPTSNVKPEHRIDYLTHVTLLRFISGPGLKPLVSRFKEMMMGRFASQDIFSEWVEMPDFYSFLKVQIFNASVEAMCGSQILSLNPTFCEDFWKFDAGLPNLAKGYPWWLIPSTYRARDRCLAHVKKWHLFLREHSSREESEDDDGFDPKLGAGLMRYRQKMWSKMEAIDAGAMASEDLGMLWGANANSAHTAFWLVYEVLRSPSATLGVRDALHSAQAQEPNPSSRLHFDFDLFCSSPLIQSIYAETLRLRSSMLIMRQLSHKDFSLNDWLIPRGQAVGVSTYDAHHAEKFWNTGSEDDPHPLNEFWAERFLVYPEDSSSGPLKPGYIPKLKQTHPRPRPSSSLPPQPAGTAAVAASDKAPYFSIDGLSGIWIPYGGGQNICPGRHFAKQEILLTLASLFSYFEIELTGPGPDIDWRTYGTGVLAPRNSVRFRIRRR